MSIFRKLQMNFLFFKFKMYILIKKNILYIYNNALQYYPTFQHTRRTFPIRGDDGKAEENREQKS
jgi:hypothetical protein